MSRVHGKKTVVEVNSVDISAHCNTSELNASTDTHDTTGYGADAHEFDPGLTNGTFSCGGNYDNDVSTGPRNVLQPLKGDAAKVPVMRQVEGAGTGLPQDDFTAIMTSYVETAPVAGMVTWRADFQISGDVTPSAQA